MTQVATQRLIDASAELGAGDRALLNLLVHHGIDDAALGRLLRITDDEAAARRELLAERLGEQLGLPPDDVRHALTELMPGPRNPIVAPAPTPGPDASSPAPAADAPAPRASARVRRRQWVRVVVAALAAIVIALIVLSSDGGSLRRTGSGPGAHVQREIPLAALPGPASAAHGQIVLRPGLRPTLSVTVTGLPALASGHYELWLYNSIVDAQPLARVGGSGGTVSVVLPPGYRHFRWLDVSRQTDGSSFDSGTSVLRASLTG